MTWVDYHLDDIALQPWYKAIRELIKLMKSESPKGWEIIFLNFISSCKASVFYPVFTSFDTAIILVLEPLIKNSGRNDMRVPLSFCRHSVVTDRLTLDFGHQRRFSTSPLDTSHRKGYTIV